MKYYSLKYVEPGEQEKFTIKGFRKGYNYDAKNSATNIWFYRKLDFTPDLDFVLNTNKVATDAIESVEISSDYLCISSKFYEVLSEFNLMDHQYFKASLRNSKLLNYHFLHFYINSTDDKLAIFDLERTTFIAKKNEPFLDSIGPCDGGLLGEFQIHSWVEFDVLRSEETNSDMCKIILPNKILSIKDREYLKLDLFTLPLGNIGASDFDFIISENLANSIIKNDFTGIKIEELPFEILF